MERKIRHMNRELVYKFVYVNMVSFYYQMRDFNPYIRA